MSGASKNRFLGPYPIRPLDCFLAGIITAWVIICVLALVGLAWFSLSGDWNVMYLLGSARVLVAILIFGSTFFTVFFMWADSQVPHS